MPRKLGQNISNSAIASDIKLMNYFVSHGKSKDQICFPLFSSKSINTFMGSVGVSYTKIVGVQIRIRH